MIYIYGGINPSFSTDNFTSTVAPSLNAEYLWCPTLGNCHVISQHIKSGQGIYVKTLSCKPNTFPSESFNQEKKLWLVTHTSQRTCTILSSPKWRKIFFKIIFFIFGNNGHISKLSELFLVFAGVWASVSKHTSNVSVSGLYTQAKPRQAQQQPFHGHWCATSPGLTVK